MSHPTPHSSAQGRPGIGERRPVALYVGSALLLFLAVSTLAFWLFTRAAVAEGTTPDAPGSILGTVKTTTGEPRADIAVTLYQLNSYDATQWRGLRTVTTQADGRYRFNLLPTGLYRIGAYDPQRVYAPTYYPTAPVIDQGADIAVTGNQRANIDLTLPLAGQITGVVTLSDGMTMTYGIAELRQQIVRDAGAVWEVVQTTPLVATQGVYSFTGLAAIPYRVCATAAYQTLAATECYDNVYAVNAATSLTPTAGATISNVNLLLGDGADFGQLRGQVTSPANMPLAKIDVYAMLVPEGIAIQPFPTAVPGIIPFAAETLYIPNPSYYAQSDESGRYHFTALAAGSYRLYFSDPTGNYAFEYYSDAQLPEMATPLTIAKKEVRTDVDIQLEPASHLQGLLTVLGQPAPNATVQAELKSGLGWRAAPGALIQLTDGFYRIDGLPAGTYRLSAFTYVSDGYTTYFYEGYAGGGTLETAATIELTSGITKSATITLTGGPRFEGAISGQVTANGAPLAGAKVGLYPGGFGCCDFALPEPLVYVFTDAQGRYAMAGLAQNYYELGVTDPAGLYATTYYTAHAVPTLANTLPIMDDKPLTAINVDLPPGGAISGQVTREDGQPVAGLRVMLYAPSSFSAPSTAIPILGVPQPVSTNGKTDAAGRYTLKGLHAGDYYLCFLDTWSTAKECYGAPPFWSGANDQGARVRVIAGQTTPQIDLLWGPDLTTYLPLIAQ